MRHKEDTISGLQLDHGSAETSVEVCERGRATWRCEKRPVKPAIASCLVPLISNQYKCGTDVRMRYQSVPHLASWSVPHLAVPRTTNFGGATPSGVKALYLCDPKSHKRTPRCAPDLCPTLPLPIGYLNYRQCCVVCVVCVFRPVSDVPSARLSPRVQCVAAQWHGCLPLLIV